MLALSKLKKAMAMGLPVVSTWHGGIPELVEDGVSSLLVPESRRRFAIALAGKARPGEVIGTRRPTTERTVTFERYDVVVVPFPVH